MNSSQIKKLRMLQRNVGYDPYDSWQWAATPHMAMARAEIAIKTVACEADARSRHAAQA